ncbi:MAG: efflux RND transporter permease subunit [Rhodobacteraceae bacterium]|nr:MAG: efflux RND transporter permease subunit [Paracoccaceae bacterium]
MTGVIDWTMARARMMVVVLLLAIAGGVVAYLALPKEGSPDIDIPVLAVGVTLPGVSALDAERLLARPLESKFQGLEGVRKMTTVAAEGRASVQLEFGFDWDKAATKAEVRALVDEARAEMPADINEPTINEINLSEFPILVVALSGDAPERTLQRLARDLQRDLEALPPVLEVGLAGQRDEMVEVLIDPLRLEAFNVTAEDLLRVVSANNRVVPAGAVEGAAGRFSVRLPGNFETADDIYATPIRVSGDRVVTLRDIAEIRRTFEDATGVARFNGAPAIALQVKQRTGENIVDTVAQVKARLEAARALWPEALREAVSVTYAMDESRSVTDMVAQLEGAVALAVALVMLVVVATLGPRPAALVGLSIPTSFLFAFLALAVFGLTLNNMVMFGLILAVGMLVDGAIVVSEYADRRLSEGATPEEAYAGAAKRMFWPIASSTATTLCAFLPMLFWPGIPGQFMGNLPRTLIFVLSASLVVALVFLPVLGVVTGRAAAGLGRLFGRRRRPPPVAAPGRRTLFGRILSPIVTNPVGPFAALAAAGVFVVGVVTFYAEHNNGVEFFVDTEPERAIVHVRARGNLSLTEKDRLVAAVERRVMDVEGVESVFAFAGASGLQTIGAPGPKDAVGQIQIELAPWNRRPPGPEVMAEVERRVADTPGVITELALRRDGPQQGKPIQLRLEANDLDVLSAAAAEARARFEALGGLVNVDDTRPLPGIDWEVTVDREAAGRFGADITGTGLLVQLVTRGALIDTIRPADSDDEIDVRVRFPESDRVLSTLETLRIRTATGLVPIGNFVTVAPRPALAEIQRFDGVRFMTVNADVAPGFNANERIAALAAGLADNPIDGVRPVFQGDQEEQAESQRFLMVAFSAALGLMFVILLAQFNSLYNSALVLSAVVLSVTGVLIGMLVTGQPLSIIMTGTGIVALAGIVVNNNIVLIDTFREFSATQPPLEAILRTAEQRIRPVLLTTITTIAGLAPMTLAASIELRGIGPGFAALFAAGPFGAEGWRALSDSVLTWGAPAALWWVQLSTAVVSGLALSTVLTLVVTPAALAARVWFWRGVAALLAAGGFGAALADRRLMREAARTPAPELIWHDPTPPVPPLAYAEAAE